MASDFDRPDYPSGPEDPPGKPKDRQTVPPATGSQADPNDDYVRGLPDALLDQYLALPSSQTTPAFWLAVHAEKQRRATASGAGSTTPSASADAGDWIAQAIKAANLPDVNGGDSALWRRYIASDPNVRSSDAGTAASAKDYWTMRIKKAENAPDVLSGKESLYGAGYTDATHHRIYGADAPAPVPTSTTGVDPSTLFDLFKQTYPASSAAATGTSAPSAGAPGAVVSQAGGQGLRFAAQPLTPAQPRPQLSLLDLAKMYAR